MTYTYTYSIASDFPNGIKSSQLQQEISANVGITQVINRIDTVGDVVNIIFNTQLTGGEQTTLNGIVSSHAPLGSEILQYSTEISDISSTEYITTLTLAFPGSTYVSGITNVKIVGYMDTGGTSYTVRLLDVDTGNVVCSSTLTNTSTSISNMGTVSNIPTGSSILELQCKTADTSTNAIIRSMIIYYN